MSGIDQYAYSSKISSVRVSDKLIYALLPLLICLLAGSNLISLIIIVVMCFSSVIWGNLSVKKYIKLLMIPSTFLVLGTLTIVVVHVSVMDSSVLYKVSLFGNIIGITRNSLAEGCRLFLKALAAVSCMYFFSLNTSMNSFFNYLRKIKFPVILIELMELMYRFIFVIWEQSNKIYIAQSSRLGYRSFRLSLSSLGALGSNIFIKSFNRIDRMNNALEARGFDGRFEYLVMEEEKCTKLRVYAIIIGTVLIMTAIMEKVAL